MLTKTHVGLALSTLAFVLGLSSGLPAQTSPRRSARCSRHRPESGAVCTREARVCPYACGEEGSRDVVCTCLRGDDDVLRWSCVEGQLCLE
jgi:hypothetical protein